MAGAKRRLTALTLLALLPLLTACGADPVAAAEARWLAAGIDAYRLEAREVRSIWCYYDLEVVVRGGQVVSALVTAHPGPAQACWHYGDAEYDVPRDVDPAQAADWTMPHLFEMARHLSAEQGKHGIKITVEFDPDIGYPNRLARDDEAVYDEDWAITVTHLEQLAD
ncbi:MAG: DUF6174 domain-containing protein [Anaerolineae bacterium]|jgi:hypothetical protein